MTTEPQPKKPRRRLWLILGAGLLVCVVLAIIAGLPGGDQPAAPAPTSVAAPAAAQPVTTEPAAPTNTPAPAPTDTPAPPPAPAPGLAQIGERVEAGGIALTINSARTVDSFDFMTAAEGKTYLVVDALIENVSRDTAPFNPLYFSVKDDQAFQYNSAMLAPDPGLKSGELPRGDRVRGNVAFEVPREAVGLVLSYEPLVLLGGFEAIRVAVDP